MKNQFQVEYVYQIKDDPYIIAKLLSKNTNFSLTPISFLGNVEIKNELTQPRALDSQGKPRFDLYIFRPKNKNQISEFKAGMILDLTSRDTIHFPEPWYATDIDLASELKKEVSAGHILYNKEVKTIGRRQDNDDVLFEVLNSDFKYAKVHLTRTGKSETLPYPKTVTYKEWNDVFNNLILKDNQEWE